ncbi:11203_t:CDS:2, partial [Acaulospora colombiana]
ETGGCRGGCLESNVKSSFSVIVTHREVGVFSKWLEESWRSRCAHTDFAKVRSLSKPQRGRFGVLEFDTGGVVLVHRRLDWFESRLVAGYLCYGVDYPAFCVIGWEVVSQLSVARIGDSTRPRIVVGPDHAGRGRISNYAAYTPLTVSDATTLIADQFKAPADKKTVYTTLAKAVASSLTSDEILKDMETWKLNSPFPFPAPPTNKP